MLKTKLTHYNKGQCIPLCDSLGKYMSRDIRAVNCMKCLEKLLEIKNRGEGASDA